MRITAASDNSLLLIFGETIGLETHLHVLQWLRVLQRADIPWVRNLQPAYASLLVTVELCLTSLDDAQAALRSLEPGANSATAASSKLVEIPVCYGGEFGPDLPEVARAHSFTESQIVELHASQLYRVYFLGFSPGFAYLGDLPESMATPRLPTPRKSVPPGSVGIANRQTAVYPSPTPGGWRLLGRTPLSMFRLDSEPHTLLAPGDQVRFLPISPEEFAAWRAN